MDYNLQDLQSAVQDDLKDPNFSLTRIARYLNYGQNAIFNTHMFKFCEAMASDTVDAGSVSVTHPADHEATIGGVLVDPTNTTRYVVLDANNYLDHRTFFQRYPLVSTYTAGTPSYWSQFGDSTYFDVPLDVDYRLDHRYYRFPTFMTDDDSVPDVPEPFRDLLELYAEFRSEKYRGNHDIAATYKQEFDDGLENMVLRYGERQQAGPVVMRSGRIRVND